MERQSVVGCIMFWLILRVEISSRYAENLRVIDFGSCLSTQNVVAKTLLKPMMYIYATFYDCVIWEEKSIE